MLKLSEEALWKAVKNNDRLYDGIFFYGVKTTGIFCRPSCKSKLPNRENVLYFADAYEAVKAGFRPCKRCRPDLAELRVEPAQEVCARVTDILQREYADPDILAKLPEIVRISPCHMQRIYKKSTGYTPKAYLQQIRIAKAKELLEGNTLNNTEICYAVGFQSLSRFYAAFHEVEGIAPRRYRLIFLNEAVRSENDKNCI